MNMLHPFTIDDYEMIDLNLRKSTDRVFVSLNFLTCMLGKGI